MAEKISQLNDQVASEKDTREMWLERYEKENINHMSTVSEFMELKADLKDHILTHKNEEIKTKIGVRQITLLQE